MFFLLAWMSRLLTFPFHSVWSANNQLTGSIPSELGELTSLTELYLGTWIVFSCWHECHACSHFFAIIFEQIVINSRVPFRANLEHWLRWLDWGSVRGLVYLVHLMYRSYECHACSHFLAMPLDQIIINSRVPFRANLENWLCWLDCGSVRGLACLFHMNVTFAHISLPFYWNRWKSTHGFHSERTRRTDSVDCPVAQYVDWFVFFIWMSRLLTFPSNSVWPDYNQLTGSIPSELRELTLLIVLWLCTWIGLSCWHECHACSNFLAILFEQMIINSQVPFRANSEN
jgi:hypothetical protein